MAEYEASVADLIRGAVQDARDLIREEIALARAEMREEMTRLRSGLVMLTAAAVAGLLGLAFLLSTAAWAITGLLQWPVWTGFGIVTVVVLAVAAMLALAGRARFARERHLPRTVDSMKENMEWLRTRTQQ